MQHVQSVSIHIAVLAVGKDAAPTQAISEQAAKAGHQIVARATVTDTQPAIRAQLTKWIEDPNIDVVIVSGGIESDNASAAVKPLISHTLPGFTDLFRYLAFQEIGASAMLSNAEAAQCGMTFVFVLPASAGAVKAAMEKLILPQLDPNTTPKNLVSSMPRVRNLSGDGIPMPIAKEKTAGGSGLTPRQPSKSPSVPVRQRSHTGANVIRKVDDTSFDPPTKEIGLAQLEKQIALSTNPPNDAETKQVDLSRLPKHPPGADPVSDDTDQIAPKDLPSRNSRLQSEPIEPPSPSRKIQRTEASAVVPPPKAPPARGFLAEPPAPRAPIGMPDSGHAPVAPLPSISPVPSTRTKGPTEPPSPARTKASTGSFAVPAVIPKTTSGPNRKAPTQPPPMKRSPTEPPPSPRPAPPRPPTTPPPRPPTGQAPTVKQPEPVALPEVAAAVSLPVPERRGPTKPPPTPPPRPPTGPVPTVKHDMSDLVSTPLRRSTGELPAGTFNYPTQRGGGSKIPLVLAGIAVLAVGFAAVVIMLNRNGGGTTAGTTKPIVAAQPIDAAVVAVDADLEPDIVLEPAGSQVGSKPSTGGRPPRGTPKQPPATGSGAKPVVPAAGSGAGSQVEPEDTVDNAPNNPPLEASDCDEVSCVLAKYDRPCCAKFKPADSDIKPRTAGGLPAELDKSMVRAGIEKVKPRVVACGEKSSEKGTVKISIAVRPDGTVKDASVVASPAPALGDCVAAAMKKAEFGKSVGGGSFTYPFVF